MQKLIAISLLLATIMTLQSKAFAVSLNCSFKDSAVRVEGVETLQINDEVLIVNSSALIALEHTNIKCGVFGRQHRFDGVGKGLQVILKSCTDSADLEGHLIDSVNSKVAEVVCDEVTR